MDSTKPASRSTRRCLDTIGCGMPSCRSISPTDCCDETSRLNIARRFGSAMISKTASIPLTYSTEHIRVKVYLTETQSLRPATPAANKIIMILEWTRGEQGCPKGFGGFSRTEDRPRHPVARENPSSVQVRPPPDVGKQPLCC